MQSGPDSLEYYKYLALQQRKEESIAKVIKHNEQCAKIRTYYEKWEIRRETNELVSPLMECALAKYIASEIEKDLHAVREGFAQSRSSSSYRVVLDLNEVEKKIEIKQNQTKYKNS